MKAYLTLSHAHANLNPEQPPKAGRSKKSIYKEKKSLFFLCRIEIIFYFCSVKNDNIKLGHGVMVTLQILVLSFQVRILVAQLKDLPKERSFFYPFISHGCHISHRQYHTHHLICFTTRQGLPTAIQSAGISRVTTEPAPITALSPMVTPGKTVTLAPSHTFSPMVIGLSLKPPCKRSTGSMAWLVQIRLHPGPMSAQWPMVMMFESRNVQFIFTNAAPLKWTFFPITH